MALQPHIELEGEADSKIAQPLIVGTGLGGGSPIAQAVYHRPLTRPLMRSLLRVHVGVRGDAHGGLVAMVRERAACEHRRSSLVLGASPRRNAPSRQDRRQHRSGREAARRVDAHVGAPQSRRRRIGSGGAAGKGFGRGIEVAIVVVQRVLALLKVAPRQHLKCLDVLKSGYGSGRVGNGSVRRSQRRRWCPRCGYSSPIRCRRQHHLGECHRRRQIALQTLVGSCLLSRLRRLWCGGSRSAAGRHATMLPLWQATLAQPEGRRAQVDGVHARLHALAKPPFHSFN